ncbi:hypothetical protein NE857_04200 [Nocardiopsis exhalans]|uniref:Uncharacterized protein n=1 Tax=Nocardiopsis exhalans TaxID=163604 RepID=A0ABY5DCT6_9ACTN|nr:hypothetical protein [Nocardiopsis exhalans]USY20863.1 hypothetical protein NE857_04200 [Nocardiopsis exhalans]
MSGNHTDPEQILDPIQQQETIHEIVRTLINSRSSSWREINFEVKSLSALTGISNWVTREGSEADREDFPHSVNQEVIKLRRGMYRYGTGTWFSMRIHILPPARFKVDFNYDEKPSYLFDPPPEEFAEDIKKFPRSPENIPAWLREELRLAEQEE